LRYSRATSSSTLLRRVQFTPPAEAPAAARHRSFVYPG
jgi:hypothetical protein